MYRAQDFSGFVYPGIAAWNISNSKQCRVEEQAHKASFLFCHPQQWLPSSFHSKDADTLHTSQFQAAMREKSEGQVYSELGPMATLIGKGIWENMF